MKKQILFALVALLLSLPSAQAAKPNFIVVFCDDLGYGDIGPFVHLHSVKKVGKKEWQAAQPKRIN